MGGKKLEVPWVAWQHQGKKKRVFIEDFKRGERTKKLHNKYVKFQDDRVKEICELSGSIPEIGGTGLNHDGVEMGRGRRQLKRILSGSIFP